MTLYIGTSGWLHPQWRGGFYPPEIPAGRWAAYYADHFDAVEMSGRSPAPDGTLAARVWTDCPHVHLTGDGPILLRLTSAVPAKRAFLNTILDDIPETVRVAAELVGEEWHRADIADLLAERGVVRCWSDRRPPWRDQHRRPADWYYLRVYGGLDGRRDTQRWLRAITRETGPAADGYAFFTDPATALDGAAALDRAAAAEGLRPPSRGALHLTG